MIRSDAEFRAILPLLLSAGALSVDTEFHTERSYHPKPMLLQLRPDEGDIFLVDPLAEIDLKPLGDVLRKVPLWMHGGQVDVQILYRITGVPPIKIFDTQVAAGCVGQGYPRRLQDLVETFLGLKMEKGETLSDWSRRPLSPDQMHYAADDVWVLPALVRVLTKELQQRGNLEISEGAMREMTEKSLVDHPADQWKQVPGVTTLDGQGRAALQALCFWRERIAEERDQPRTAILSDGLLLDLSRRRPQTVEQLHQNRRFPGQVIKRDGREILEILRLGRNDLPPLMQLPTGWADLVRAAWRISELEQGIAPELVLSSSVLNSLSQGVEVEGWRKQAMGQRFLRFLAGEESLSMPPVWRKKN